MVRWLLRLSVWTILSMGTWQVLASSASSSNFRLEGSNLDTSGGRATSSNFAVSSCLGAAVAGLSASNSFRLEAGCAALATITVAQPTHGSCNNPSPSLFAPAGHTLCTSGTPNVISGGARWEWTCSGSNGGTTASCSSDVATTSTGSGSGWASLNGTFGWVVDTANTGFISSAGQGIMPLGYQFPHGLLKIRLINGTAGTAATITITYPSPLPSGTVYWKYGPTMSNTNNHWYVFSGAVISGNTVTLSLTDGADGDSDLLINGIISDPGGPGIPIGIDTAIPTLSEWMLLLLAGIMVWLSLRRLRLH